MCTYVHIYSTGGECSLTAIGVAQPFFKASELCTLLKLIDAFRRERRSDYCINGMLDRRIHDSSSVTPLYQADPIGM